MTEPENYTVFHVQGHPSMTPNPPTKVLASSLLQSASNIVEGKRNVTHGDKERSFVAIAALWSAYLQARRVPNYDLTPVDVAHLMILMKMARTEWGEAVEDHWVDMAGYAGIAGELALGGDAH